MNTKRTCFISLICRNSLRRIATNDDTEFSRESIVNLMEKFVKTVNVMDETILVPCRLMDRTVSVKLAQIKSIQSDTKTLSMPCHTHTLALCSCEMWYENTWQNSFARSQCASGNNSFMAMAILLFFFSSFCFLFLVHNSCAFSIMIK